MVIGVRSYSVLTWIFGAEPAHLRQLFIAERVTSFAQLTAGLFLHLFVFFEDVLFLYVDVRCWVLLRGQVLMGMNF